MDNRVIEKVFEHWEGLRSGRAAPARSEIDPRAIEEALENLFILEQRRDRDIRFRLAGRRINLIFGHEMRGHAVTEMFAPTSASGFLQLVAQTLSEPATAKLSVVAEPEEMLTGQMILLPMADDSGMLTRLLGCLVASPVLPRTPVRLVVRDELLTSISIVRQEPIISDLPGFSEPVVPYVPPARPTLIRAFDTEPENTPFSPRSHRPVLTVVKRGE